MERLKVIWYSHPEYRIQSLAHIGFGISLTVDENFAKASEITIDCGCNFHSNKVNVSFFEFLKYV